MNSIAFESTNKKIAFYCATLFSFFIIFGPALTNLFLFFTLLFVILSGNLKSHLIDAWANPISKFSFIFFLLFFIGIFWSIAETSDALRVWKKYLPFFFIPMLIPLFNSVEKQRLGINIFLSSTLIVLTISYLIYFGLISEFDVSIPGRHRPLNVSMEGGFQSHIITGILITFSTFIYLIKFKYIDNNKKFLYLFLILISSYYIFIISPGLTGKALLLVLFLFYILKNINKKWNIILVVVTLSTFFIAANNIDLVKKTHPNIKFTIEKILHTYQIFFEETTPENVNFRPQRNINSIKMITSDPWIGTGTGSYLAAYKSKLPEIEAITTGTKRNPHNEYLSIGVQLGLLGILFFVYLFYLQFRHSLKNKDREIKDISQGFIVFMIVGCVANSMIMDSGEGHFYAYFSALLFSQYQQKEA